MTYTMKMTLFLFILTMGAIVVGRGGWFFHF